MSPQNEKRKLKTCLFCNYFISIQVAELKNLDLKKEKLIEDELKKNPWFFLFLQISDVFWKSGANKIAKLEN